MRSKQALIFAVTVSGLTVLVAVSLLAQQDRYTLKLPGGLAFSGFKGYDAWETIAVSETEGSVKAILGNPTMINAYKEGVPNNGKAFPEGSQAVKIEWIKKKNPVAPYFVEVPDTLKTISFIEKDSKRFPNTHGWAFAQFAYDPESKTFKPPVTGSECGYTCHTRVAATDYIFTAYPPRVNTFRTQIHLQARLQLWRSEWQRLRQKTVRRFITKTGARDSLLSSVMAGRSVRMHGKTR